MKSNEQYAHYGSVIIPMCKNTALENEPWKCVRFVKSNNICTCHPDFGAGSLAKEFAVAVIEGEAVFMGDKVYHKKIGQAINITHPLTTFTRPELYSWKKPKMLNGKVIKVGNVVFRQRDGEAFTVREITDRSVRLTKVGDDKLNSILLEEHYVWNLSECAIGELEGVPVYPGAIIYRRGKPLEVIGNVDDDFTEGRYFRARSTNGDTSLWSINHLNVFSWKPPIPKKRTFLLNGVELPCPVEQPKIMWCSITINNQEFHFENGSDALKVKEALVGLMSEARDK